MLTLVSYVPAMRGDFIWDDDAYVTRNRTLETAGGLRRIWFEIGATPQYYPLVFSTFWLERRVWDLNPFGYHLTNVLLHAASAVLLWRILRRLSVPGAWLAAAVFAVHPVQVESVAWITERKNVLSGVFYFASMLAYLRFTGLESDARRERRPWRLYALSFVCFAAALLSKTVTCSLPAVVVLLLWWKRSRLDARELLPLAPMFVLGAYMGLMTARLEKVHVGALGAEWHFSVIDRFLIAGRALGFYAYKLLWPAELMFFYPRWRVDDGVWWQYLFPLAFIAVAAGLWLARRTIGRGPLVAVLIYAGTLFPALGFFDVYPFRYSFVADHFAYLGGVSLIALMIALPIAGWRKIGSNPQSAIRNPQSAPPPPLSPSPPLRKIAGGVLIFALAALTARQGHVYRDLETLWLDTIRKNPGGWAAYDALGALRYEQERYDEALELHTKAMERYPEEPNVRFNRGNALLKLGRTDAAVEAFEDAIELRPGFAAARVQLGTVLADRNDLDGAIDCYRRALEADPEHFSAHMNLGVALVHKARFDEGIAQYLKAAALRPEESSPLNNVGIAFARQGRLEEAVAWFRKALTVAPDDADVHTNLGQALLHLGRLDDAIMELEKALRANPEHGRARALLDQARFQRSLKQSEKVGTP